MPAQPPEHLFGPPASVQFAVPSCREAAARERTRPRPLAQDHDRPVLGDFRLVPIIAR
jgi:hypothetical protein